MGHLFNIDTYWWIDCVHAMYACLCIDKSWAVSQTSSEQFTYMSPWDLCMYMSGDMSEDSNNARKHFTFCLMCLDIPLTTRCHCTQRTTILEYHYVMGCKMKISDKYIIIIVAISTFIHDGWQQYNIHLLYVYDCYHNGICFNQPYYDLCIPAAKCLMSDLISSFFHYTCSMWSNCECVWFSFSHHGVVWRFVLFQIILLFQQWYYILYIMQYTIFHLH